MTLEGKLESTWKRHWKGHWQRAGGNAGSPIGKKWAHVSFRPDVPPGAPPAAPPGCVAGLCLAPQGHPMARPQQAKLGEIGTKQHRSGRHRQGLMLLLAGISACTTGNGPAAMATWGSRRFGLASQAMPTRVPATNNGPDIAASKNTATGRTISPPVNTSPIPANPRARVAGFTWLPPAWPTVGLSFRSDQLLWQLMPRSGPLWRGGAPGRPVRRCS